MTDTLNEKWRTLGGTLGAFAIECGDTVIAGATFDLSHEIADATVEHIVEIHNFIVECGGLERVKEALEALREPPALQQRCDELHELEEELSKELESSARSFEVVLKVDGKDGKLQAIDFR